MTEPLTLTAEDTCGTCKHFKPDASTGRGWCLALPPRAQLVPQQNALGQTGMMPISFFPVVNNGEYCGVHIKKGYDA